MSTAKNPAYLISHSGNVTVNMGGKVYSATPTHGNYKIILEKLKKKQFKGLSKLFNVGEAIKRHSRKTLNVLNGQVTYGGKPLHNVVVDRIMRFMAEGFDFKPLTNFLRRLLNNPSENSVDQLYRFMEANNLTVTWDGYVLCYKSVNKDYKDHHSNTLTYAPGETVEMPREKVVEDPNNPCGPGLHVGGLAYVAQFGNVPDRKVMLMKLDPADVVSVPTDYSSGKCRACKVTVLEEFKDVDRVMAEQGLTQKEVTRPKEHGCDNQGWRYDDDEDDDSDVCEECGEEWDYCECD